MKNAIILVLILSATWLQAQDDGLVGHWKFDNANILTQATVGKNLVLTGSQQAVTGPDTDNGAVKIGVGSYYSAEHGIEPNAGGSLVNEFTLVMDLKIPSTGQWYTMYQSDLTNTNDGEWFINPSGNMGVGATGYTEYSIKRDEWYRLAISVKNGQYYNYYVDGQLALSGAPGNIDDRFALADRVLLFADENREDNPIDVAEIKIFSRALATSEIFNMGGYGHLINEIPLPEPDSLDVTYLQTPTPTSIFVCWHANSGTESIVEYGTTEALGNTQEGDYHEFDVNTIWHTVKLADLTPSTVYYYKCISDTLESEIKKFKTPPVKGSSEGHIRFGVVGDNRTEPFYCAQTTDNMKAKMIELYGDLVENVNLIFNVGDIVTTGGTLSQYRNEYFNPNRSISGEVPFMVSIGNHEGEAEHYYHYMKYEELGGAEGEKYYSFQLSRVLFITINANSPMRNDTQIAWLDSSLAQAEQDDSIDWVFAFTHQPGHSEVWPDGNTAYIQDRVIPLLTKYSKAEFLLYGHSHNYERGATNEGNLRLMLSGGGGSALDRWGMYGNQRDYPEIQRSFDHYCYAIFDIDIANRSYTCQSYSLGTKDYFLDNQLIDSFYRKQIGTNPPEKPEQLATPDTVELPCAFEVTEYIGDEPILSSFFQFTQTPGDYSQPVFESKRDFENIYWDTGAPDYTPIDQNEGIDLSKFTLNNENLLMPGNYYWRIRYRDRNLQWSEWSDEKSLYIKSSFKKSQAYNKSLKFDGLESYVYLADNLNEAALPTKAISVETWVKLKSTNTWGGYIGAVQDNGDYEKGWVLGNYQNAFSFALASQGTDDGNGNLTYLTADHVIEQDQWYHVAGTYDGAMMKIYVNGQLKGYSTAQSGNILYDLASYFSLGAYYDDNEFNVLDGQLDEIRLWQTALTREVIQDWMHQELNSNHPDYANLISYWDFNVLHGDTLIDANSENNGQVRKTSILSHHTSTVPVGLRGEFVNSIIPNDVGSFGTQLQATIKSTPNEQNYLGLYQAGENNGNAIDFETFPEGINYRSPIYWGVAEYGTVTADLVFFYLNIEGIAPADSLRFLKRADANSEWEDITENVAHEQAKKTFNLNSVTELTTEFTLGWKNKVVASVNPVASKLPLRYSLSQNYPNPFNPHTKIDYSIKNNNQVKVMIYNVTGQKVATLVDKYQQAGFYQIQWDASDVSSGVYFYRIEAGSFTDLKKCIVIK